MAYGNRVPQVLSYDLPPPTEKEMRAIADFANAVERERRVRAERGAYLRDQLRHPVAHAPGVVQTAAAMSSLPAAVVSAAPLVWDLAAKAREQGWDLLDDPGFKGAMLLGAMTAGRGSGKTVTNFSKASFPRSVAKEVARRRGFNASRAEAIKTAKESVTEASKRYSQADVNVQAAWQGMKKAREAMSFSNYERAVQSHGAALSVLEKAGGDAAVAREALAYARGARSEPGDARVAAWLARRGRRNRAYDKTIWSGARPPASVTLDTLGAESEAAAMANAFGDPAVGRAVGRGVAKAYVGLESAMSGTLGPRLADLLFPEGAWNVAAKRAMGTAAGYGWYKAAREFGSWREEQKADDAQAQNQKDYTARTNASEQATAPVAEPPPPPDIPDASTTLSFENSFGL